MEFVRRQITIDIQLNGWEILTEEQYLAYEAERKAASLLAYQKYQQERTKDLIRKLEAKFRSRIINIKLGKYKGKKQWLMRHPIEQMIHLNKLLSENARKNRRVGLSTEYAQIYETILLEFEAAIKEKIKSLESFQINKAELCQEAFKPSRVMYQLSIEHSRRSIRGVDPDYYE